MSETDINELKVLMNTLIGKLDERCPARQKQIDENTKDLDKAFDQIKKVKETMAKWSVISSIGTAVLTAAVVKFFVG